MIQTAHSLLYGETAIVPVPFDGLEPRSGDEPILNAMTEVLLDDGSDADVHD